MFIRLIVLSACAALLGDWGYTGVVDPLVPFKEIEFGTAVPDDYPACAAAQIPPGAIAVADVSPSAAEQTRIQRSFGMFVRIRGQATLFADGHVERTVVIGDVSREVREHVSYRVDPAAVARLLADLDDAGIAKQPSRCWLRRRDPSVPSCWGPPDPTGTRVLLRRGEQTHDLQVLSRNWGPEYPAPKALARILDVWRAFWAGPGMPPGATPEAAAQPGPIAPAVSPGG
ncbi:MAG: hypothetical protein KC657_29500 [Myxococcales bacterium]|nr:hypothetical protein [Myxococcales bacterium]